LTYVIEVSIRRGVWVGIGQLIPLKVNTFRVEMYEGLRGLVNRKGGVNRYYTYIPKVTIFRHAKSAF